MNSDKSNYFIEPNAQKFSTNQSFLPNVMKYQFLHFFHLLKY